MPNQTKKQPKRTPPKYPAWQWGEDDAVSRSAMTQQIAAYCGHNLDDADVGVVWDRHGTPWLIEVTVRLVRPHTPMRDFMRYNTDPRSEG